MSEPRKTPPRGPPASPISLLDFEGGGHLAYVDVRRLGEIGLVDDPERFIDERGLGPDALDPALDVEGLARMLEGSRAAVKSALMDQGRIAGVGNVYADEVLFQAGIHPGRRAGSLERDDVESLHRALRRVLRAAVDAGVEDFPEWFLLPHRHQEGRCPECGTPLEKTRVSGRSTYHCPKRQGREPGT